MPFPLTANDLNPLLRALDKQEELLKRIATALEEMNERAKKEKEGE